MLIVVPARIAPLPDYRYLYSFICVEQRVLPPGVELLMELSRYITGMCKSHDTVRVTAYITDIQRLLYFLHVQQQESAKAVKYR